MDPALENIGWTEEQWNRVCSVVTEEAQKARVAAQILPVSGPEDANTIAVANFTLTDIPNLAAAQPPARRLRVDSDPTLFLTTLAVNVQLRGVEVAAPDLAAALAMFRRAANYIARLEDALIFLGRSDPRTPPLMRFGLGLGRPAGIPDVVRITGDGDVGGIFQPLPALPNGRLQPQPVVPPVLPPERLVSKVIAAIGNLEGNGQLGPFACVLGQELFNDSCTPTAALVLPRDRILPFLQGPLVRSTTILPNWGAVIALSGNPIEIVVASDIHVQFLQATLEPRYVFRVSERIALRVKEDNAIALLNRA